MRIGWIVLGVLLAVVAFRKFHPSTTFAADGTDAAWDQAVATSRENNRPAVLLFTASWCPACQALHSRTLSSADVVRELRAHTFITIDLTNPTQSASKRASDFGVNSIPTLIRFDRSGRETARTHFLSSQQMIAWLREDD